jgi:lipopolysaccharide transport system permease protein
LTLPTTSTTDSDYQVIEPSSRWRLMQLGELWQYRELLLFMVWRDVSVRYKQTLLGVTWAVIQPFTQMVVFTVFFGTLAQLPSDGQPYAIFNYAGLLPWTLFGGSITKATASLVASGNLIKKVYFPRVLVPMSAVFSGLPDFFLAFLLMLGLMLYFGVPIIALNLVVLLPFLLIALITALGIGFWLSALNALYRDVGHIVPFFVQMWFFITPVLYSTDLIGEEWQVLYALNPMVAVVQGFRWVLLGSPAPDATMVLLAVSIGSLLLVTGLIFFKRVERVFADIV